jgi:hypothetical protein
MMDPNDFLNGAFAGPITRATQPLATAPGETATSTGNQQAVFIAWLVLFALLVVANVLTLSVQR